MNERKPPTPPLLNALEICNSCDTERALTCSPAGYCLACERNARRADDVPVNLTFERDSEPHRQGTLGAFLDENAGTLSDDDLLTILCLRPGDLFQLGGGTAPLHTLKRLA